MSPGSTRRDPTPMNKMSLLLREPGKKKLGATAETVADGNLEILRDHHYPRGLSPIDEEEKRPSPSRSRSLHQRGALGLQILLLKTPNTIADVLHRSHDFTNEITITQREYDPEFPDIVCPISSSNRPYSRVTS